MYFFDLFLNKKAATIGAKAVFSFSCLLHIAEISYETDGNEYGFTVVKENSLTFHGRFQKRASSRSFRFGRLFDGTLLHLECERRQDHKNTHYSFHLEYTTGGSDHNRPTSSSVAFWKNTGCHPLCRPKNGLFISVRNHHSFRRSMNDGRLFFIAWSMLSINWSCRSMIS